MRIAAALLVLALAAPLAQAAPDPDYVKSILAWRERAEKSLRADNGWLTLAGRYVMKPGANTFGTGPNNDIVFPRGLGPERIGTLKIEFSTVTLALEKGVTMKKDGQPFTERVLGTNVDKRDWVTMGRLAMHVIERDGHFVLRLADNRSEVRKRFRGRLWYDVKAPWLVDARYFAYPKGKTITIINVLDEASEEPAPGYVEFTLNGKTHRLDAVGDDEGLFFVFRDGTSGDTTYKPARFLYVEKKPEPGKPFKIDFNRAYNPPCAFSEFTTCPLPPKQNILDVRIEAGEKYPPRKAAG
jgi:uncharacterized protein (DUF1684 family)